MRTLFLLIALPLLALQTQAEPPLGRAEEVLDQEQLGEDEQGVSIFLGGDDSTALQDADVRSGVTCYCRRGGCRFPERLLGYCRDRRNIVYRLCCRR
ncbi:Neutrophil antibiotic peptide NP-1 [Microtus ochrogaster]|uniref:Neutrophil antibiotic peptide NP-1 n=1 Tax=Microtus ochrogaster TaxID=79684 RepID=A0A8J6GJ12_MICOH|nr:Neutrophil antibiotic peptide NP-1 [Microtus ochrogaster]